MSRRPNRRAIKSHRSYTVDEAADVLGVHKNTVRNWIRDGLPVMSAWRPILILGAALKEFLEERYAKRKRPLKPGEIYCVACKSQKQPAGAMADFVGTVHSRGELRGLCPDCGRLIRRFVNVDGLARAARGLDLGNACEPGPVRNSTGISNH